MPKDTFWFSHDYNSRNDGKLLKLRMKHGMEGVGIYWCIVEMLYEESGFISLNDYERITFELRSNEETVRSVINDFGLFEVNCDKFWSNTAIERLKVRKDKSDKAKESINTRWEAERKRKLLEINNTDTVVLQTNNDSNTIKDNIDNIDKINQNKENMVVVEMVNIFKEKNPSYFYDKETDYSACLSIAYKIAEYKGWKKVEVIDIRKNDVLSAWRNIVNFIAGDEWLNTRSLSDLSTTKEFQRLVQKMTKAATKEKS